MFFSNGKIYCIQRMSAEMWTHYYKRAWWIINQNPSNDTELKEFELESRKKFAEEYFGCYYEE
jgi:hypothetical protein